MRLQNLQQEIAAVRAANAELQRQVDSDPRAREYAASSAHDDHPRKRHRSSSPHSHTASHHSHSHSHSHPHSHSQAYPHSHSHSHSHPHSHSHASANAHSDMPRRESARFVLPSHLHGLRDTLQPALLELQRPDPLDVSIDDATILWES